MALGDHLPVQAHLGQRLLGQVGGGVRGLPVHRSRTAARGCTRPARARATDRAGHRPAGSVVPGAPEQQFHRRGRGRPPRPLPGPPGAGRGGEPGLGEPPVGHRSGVVACRRGQDRLGHQEIGEHVITGDGQGHEHLRRSAVKRDAVLGEPGPLLGGEGAPSAADRGVVVQDADQGRQVEQFQSTPRRALRTSVIARDRLSVDRAVEGRASVAASSMSASTSQGSVRMRGSSLAGREQVAEQGVAVGVEELPAVQPGEGDTPRSVSGRSVSSTRMLPGTWRDRASSTASSDGQAATWTSCPSISNPDGPSQAGGPGLRMPMISAPRGSGAGRAGSGPAPGSLAGPLW